jgi:hypothetical protein
MPSDEKPTVTPHLEPGLNDDTLGVLAAAILLFGAVLWAANFPNLEKVDFSLTYVGAKLVHDGQGSQLYNVELQRQTRDSLFHHPNPLFFEHPPFEAVILAPLSAISFRAAYTICGLINATVWLVLMVIMRPLFGWPRETLAYLPLWLLFAPLAVALYQGQSSIILLALFALAFTLEKRGRELAAGMALGLGLVKFQFVLPFMFVFLLRRKWRFLAGFVISSCILAVLSLSVLGVHGIAQYLRFVISIAENPQNQSYGSAVDMPTIHGFLYAVLGERVGHIGLNLLSILLSITLLAWVAHRWQLATSERDHDMLFGAAIASSLLAGSHMFTHDFSPLIVAMFLAAARFRELTSRWRFAEAIALVIFWSFPIYFLCVAWHCLYLMCPVLLLFVFSVVGVARDSSQYRRDQVQYVGA